MKAVYKGNNKLDNLGEILWDGTYRRNIKTNCEIEMYVPLKIILI